MSFKFKRLKSDIAKLDLSVRQIKDEFIRSSSAELEKIIVEDNIKKGFSPVAGAGRYQSYSESYKKAIRAGYAKPKTKTTPVNLTQTGDMLDSFKISKTSKSIVLRFTNKLASIHNFLGAGKSKVVRPMLPIGNEGFKPSVNKQILDLLKDAVDKIVAKLK